jgi:hypothetical protein
VVPACHMRENRDSKYESLLKLLLVRLFVSSAPSHGLPRHASARHNLCLGKIVSQLAADFGIDCSMSGRDVVRDTVWWGTKHA